MFYQVIKTQKCLFMQFIHKRDTFLIALELLWIFLWSGLKGRLIGLETINS